MFENINSKNCPCGKDHEFTSKIIIEEGAIGRLPLILDEMNLHSAFLLADRNTDSAAGEKVTDVLKSHHVRTEKYVFREEHLEPNEANIGLAMMNFKSDVDVVIGVGSGVINDIGKIMAKITGKPYVIVATAPSMDGYASATSSMTMEGLKISIGSKCPDVIIGDTNILCKAPVRMMISGLGDMIAKYVSICEWRISHVINGEYYCEEIACLVRSALQKCVDNAEGLLIGEKAAVKAVFEGLILCGAAMKFAGMSRPASGIEHYLSHIWDMRGVEFDTPVDFHGIQCAVGTLIAVKLYEKIKQVLPDREKAAAYVKDFDFAAWSGELRAFLGKGAESMIALEAKERKYDLKTHEKRLEKIIEKWDEIQKIIKEELPSVSELETLYDKVGLPKTMGEIGLNAEILPMTFKAAKDIRDKYVLPRLCWDLGIIDELF